MGSLLMPLTGVGCAEVVYTILAVIVELAWTADVTGSCDEIAGKFGYSFAPLQCHAAAILTYKPAANEGNLG
jgi:hypothetical protein